METPTEESKVSTLEAEVNTNTASSVIINMPSDTPVEEKAATPSQLFYNSMPPPLPPMPVGRAQCELEQELHQFQNMSLGPLRSKHPGSQRLRSSGHVKANSNGKNYYFKSRMPPKQPAPFRLAPGPAAVARKLTNAYDDLRAQKSLLHLASSPVYPLLGPMKLVREAILMCNGEDPWRNKQSSTSNNHDSPIRIDKFQNEELPRANNEKDVNSSLRYLENLRPNGKLIPFFKSLGIPEATLIDCVYCSMLHPGPHCYEGNCAEFSEICYPGSPPRWTQAICFNCGGRHSPAYDGPLPTSQASFCQYCQKVHNSPSCVVGTCTSNETEPYICSVSHLNYNCSNSACFLFGKDIKNWIETHPTLYVCNVCGARHLGEKPRHNSKTVACLFCHTRHYKPACTAGPCRSPMLVTTPLATVDGFPVLIPEKKHRCVCGRRHLELSNNSRPYGSVKRATGIVTIRCLTCNSYHQPPLCSEGTCDSIKTSFPNVTLRQQNYICEVCNYRHLPNPQKLSRDQIRDSTHNCETCGLMHGPGICIQARNCIEARTLCSKPTHPKTSHQLKCPICWIRHIKPTALTKLIKREVEDDEVQALMGYSTRYPASYTPTLPLPPRQRNPIPIITPPPKNSKNLPLSRTGSGESGSSSPKPRSRRQRKEARRIAREKKSAPIEPSAPIADSNDNGSKSDSDDYIEFIPNPEYSQEGTISDANKI